MVTRNVIPDRIADALGRFPPFSMLPQEDVLRLAEEATVRFHVAGEKIWNQGDPPGEELLFLARGRVEYVWQAEGRPELVDVRDVGDVLGLTALIEGKAFRVTAQVVEESLTYGLAWAQVKPLLDAHDAARNYARRHLFWATRVGGSVASPRVSEGNIPGRTNSILQAHLDGARVIEPRPIDRLLTCSPDDTIQHAAALMSAKRVPSVLVADGEGRPLGIVTNNNLVRHVIVGKIGVGEPVARVMASPVVTVAVQSSATAAILIMMRERIGQVCVTTDGTPNSRALDVCTHKDLLALGGHHPSGLLRELRMAHSPARFRELCDEIATIARSYLEAGVSAVFVGQICAELYDELVQNLLMKARDELTREGVVLPEVPWAWMSVGSDGRREQILRTDMDNALVFESTGDAADDEQHRKVFLQLTGRVVEMLVGCGFSRCQGGVMASNPRWCRTDAEWAAELGDVDALGTEEGLLRALVLYDLRYVAGEQRLCAPLRKLVFEAAGLPAVQLRLAELVVATPPPLNFIGKFLVESFGAKHPEFDIKSRGLAPLRDAARVLVLKHQLPLRYSTGGRWEDIGRKVPRMAELAGLAQDAYDRLLRLRTLTGMKRGDAGRKIDPATLSKLEREQLAHVFDVVRMVQEALRVEFLLELRR